MAANSSEYIKHHLTNLVYGQHPDGSWGIAKSAAEAAEMGFWKFHNMIEARETTASQHEDFLQMLIESRYDDGSSMDEVLMQNQAKMFLFGGNGPPSKIITWALYFLAKHPE